MRVLLVDDEEELVSTLAERLALRGIEADWVVTADNALRVAESEPYDVAVVDVKIPGISGIELKKRLQKKCPHMKFVFMTGHGSEADYEAASAEAGAQYYLAKPVNIGLLIERMKEALNE